MRSQRPHIRPPRTLPALWPSPTLTSLILLISSLAHAQSSALSNAIIATKPAPFFAYTLNFNYTSFGTPGCDDVFASGRILTYNPPPTRREEPQLTLPYETFALNKKPCSALFENYTASDTIPESSPLKSGASLLTSPNGTEPAFALAAILVAPASAQPSSIAAESGVACPGSQDIVIGDQVHVVLRNNFSRPAFDPRKGSIDVRAGLRYALVAIGFASKGENLCILIAEEDTLYREENQVTVEKEDENSEDMSDNVSSSAVVGIIFGSIGVLVIVGALLAWMHFK